jgi:ribosomal protein S24E
MPRGSAFCTTCFYHHHPGAFLRVGLLPFYITKRAAAHKSSACLCTSVFYFRIFFGKEKTKIYLRVFFGKEKTKMYFRVFFGKEKTKIYLRVFCGKEKTNIYFRVFLVKKRQKYI